MVYEHTQTAYVSAGIAVATATILFLSLVASSGGERPVLPVVVGVIALVLVVFFSRLSVTVSATEVTSTFGFGWPTHTVAIADIVEVERVRTKWYHSWGYRLIRGGLMYNVWGLDAVELRVSEQKIFRIGTDDPEGLLETISRAISSGT